ncbi:hypothetical protein P168DRAFT_191200 [Aspergillus campestris IBT 28561]|uniref:Uncharacterized protein n=1 Tax=Aspergillus campestris (strain IBT 28561) TaxID=1392248 RepID=A0A2I1CYU1_ASPC2|nr:uncharacterized protein P168DRAFT_191200 [Aspergillus campestris IBT 28561]PKY02780.1 hypothetical protein P168DRAFT_191200 [Aspergillus campestris IBT 28561]
MLETEISDIYVFQSYIPSIGGTKSRMPVYKLDDQQPKQPPWGELPLEVYFLSEWETLPPDPSQSNESPADRRKRLVRQFLALGFEGRQESPPIPTENQIDEILRPIRPEALRAYADDTASLSGLWLRLCYTDEEAHKTLWAENEDAEWVGDDGIVLDDESIFSGLDLAAALEVFPERVTNEPVDLEFREAQFREMVDAAQESPCPSAENYSDEVKELLARGQAESEKNPLNRYWPWHAASVVTHVFVEDEVVLRGGGLLHVFLDDYGNVVRQWRVENDGSESNYDGAWFEGCYKEAFACGMGGSLEEIGPAYHEGGSRGPPYY